MKKQRAIKKDRYITKTQRNTKGFYGMISRDFSVIEDNKYGWQIIRELAIKAGNNAAAEAKAAGLSRVYVRNNQLLREDNAGNITVLQSNRPEGKSFFIRYSPSVILHAKSR